LVRVSKLFSIHQYQEKKRNNNNQNLSNNWKGFFKSFFMATTKEYVFSNLPFLIPPPDLPNDETLVDNFIMQSQIQLQCDLGKTDAEVHDESTYNPQEKLIVAFYTCMKLLMNKGIENVGGTEGNAPTGNKILSEAKADVTLAKWTVPRASDGSLMIVGLAGMIASFKKQLCDLASSCGYDLQICDCGSDGLTGETLLWDIACGLDDCC